MDSLNLGRTSSAFVCSKNFGVAIKYRNLNVDGMPEPNNYIHFTGLSHLVLSLIHWNFHHFIKRPNVLMESLNLARTSSAFACFQNFGVAIKYRNLSVDSMPEPNNYIHLTGLSHLVQALIKRLIKYVSLVRFILNSLADLLSENIVLNKSTCTLSIFLAGWYR